MKGGTRASRPYAPRSHASWLSAAYLLAFSMMASTALLSPAVLAFSFLWITLPSLSMTKVQRWMVEPRSKVSAFPSTFPLALPPAPTGTPNFLATSPFSSPSSVKGSLFSFLNSPRVLAESPLMPMTSAPLSVSDL